MKVGTLHFHKGNECDDVILTNNFVNFFSKSTGGLDPNLNKEQLYILFVAITRARKILYISKLLNANYKQLKEFFRHDNNITNDGKENEVEEDYISNHENKSADDLNTTDTEDHSINNKNTITKSS